MSSVSAIVAPGDVLKIGDDTIKIGSQEAEGRVHVTVTKGVEIKRKKKHNAGRLGRKASQ